MWKSETINHKSNKQIVYNIKYSKQTDLVLSCMQFQKKKKWRKLIEKVTFESLLQEKDYF